MITSQLSFVINFLGKYLIKYIVFLLHLHPQCKWKIHDVIFFPSIIFTSICGFPKTEPVLFWTPHTHWNFLSFIKVINLSLRHMTFWKIFTFIMQHYHLSKYFFSPVSPHIWKHPVWCNAVYWIHAWKASYSNTMSGTNHSGMGWSVVLIN